MVLRRPRLAAQGQQRVLLAVFCSLLLLVLMYASPANLNVRCSSEGLEGVCWCDLSYVGSAVWPTDPEEDGCGVRPAHPAPRC